MSLRTLLPVVLAGVILGLSGAAHGRGLTLSLFEEVGRDGHIYTEDGDSTSDVYAKTGVRLGLAQPVIAFDEKMSFAPVGEIYYTKYRKVDELDTVGFNLSGPLALRLEGIGDESDSLTTTARLSRETGAVSTVNESQATRTRIALHTLYSRHWGSPRWVSEFGYDYDQEFYDDSAYEDRDLTVHTFSAAMLYRMNPATQVGLRTSYALDRYSDSVRMDADTWEVAALVRRQITNRITGDLAVGHEQVTYADDEEESGVTVRGRLDYQVTPRWHCGAEVRHYLEPSEVPGDTGMTTTEGRLAVAYRFTPKLNVSAGPGWIRQSDDDATVKEASFGVGATYAVQRYRVILRTTVIDRDSDWGGDDSYTAVDASLRLEVDL